MHRAVGAAPNDSEAPHGLAVALQGAGEIVLTIQSYARALALDPNHAQAHNNLGVALAAQRRFEEAAASYGAALAIRPDYAEADNNLGVALVALGRPIEAVAAHRRALERRPDYGEAHYNLGNDLQGAGKPVEAAEAYRDHRKVSPVVAEHGAMVDRNRVRPFRCLFRHARHACAAAFVVGHNLFRGAQMAFAKLARVKPQPVTEAAFHEWLSREGTGLHHRPLFITAAALYGVIEPDVPVVRLAGKEINQKLAKRELRRMADECRSAGLENDQTISRLSAFAALRGDLDGNGLRQIAGLGFGLNLPPPGKIFDEVQETGRLVDGILPEFRPDIVAAALVVAVLGQDPTTAPELLWAALGEDLSGGLNRLGRLSYVAEVVFGLFEQSMSTWLKKSVEGQLERCRALEPILRDPTLERGLLPAAIATWRTLLTEVKDYHRQGDLWNSVSAHLSAMGKYLEALEASKQSVTVVRRLRKSDLARYETDLARSMGSLGSILRKEGRIPEAVDAFQEGIGLIEPYAARYPDGPASRLLQGLQNHLRWTEGGGKD